MCLAAHMAARRAIGSRPLQLAGRLGLPKRLGVLAILSGPGVGDRLHCCIGTALPTGLSAGSSSSLGGARVGGGGAASLAGAFGALVAVPPREIFPPGGLLGLQGEA